jgi:TolB-like protein
LKTGFTVVAFFVATLSVYGQSGIVSLDEAIQNSSLKIQDGLNRGSTIIVYQFQSNNSKISDYVLKELFDKLVNSHKFIVLDRTAQEVINAEIDFQFKQSAGMISDESLASLTKRIGAEAIVTGSLDDAGNEYRFRIRVIGTETTAAIVSHAESLNKNDRRIAAFQPKLPKTVGEKIGTGALNILLGLGSYLEGDVAGGITLTAGYLVSAELFVIEATALDWDSPTVGIPATLGVTVAGLAIIYGFARPFIYNYSPQLATIMDNTQPRIVFTSNIYGNQNIGFQIAYTVKF